MNEDVDGEVETRGKAEEAKTQRSTNKIRVSTTFDMMEDMAKEKEAKDQEE